jgi:hypothetical protein
LTHRSVAGATNGQWLAVGVLVWASEGVRVHVCPTGHGCAPGWAHARRRRSTLYCMGKLDVYRARSCCWLKPG